jgi:predicted PurR-regulated permease PerM
MRADTPRSGLVIARVGAGLALLAATLLVLRDFLVPMTWAAIAAFMSWGAYARVRDLTGRPVLTAALFTLVFLIVFAVPAGWLVVMLAEQSIRLLRYANEWIAAGSPLPDWITTNRFLGPRIDEIRGAIPAADELGPHVAQAVRALSGTAASMATGIAQGLFDFVITMIALFVFYAQGEGLLAHTRRLLAALFPERPPEFIDHVGRVVRAVVVAVLGTALVQGAIAAFGFALFGVPSPIALGALTALLAFIPGGVVVVWGGAAIWLWSTGHTGAAIGMTVWGLVPIGSIDNVLRPIMISRSGAGDIPFLLVLLGVIGGLSAFGMLGLLLGPVVPTIAFTLVKEIGTPPVTTPSAAAGPPL